ncbi:MAG: hypothetical protein WC971_06145 [Coriobacteriia bacterium]
MMGFGRGIGTGFNNMMGSGWSGGLPMFLLGALVVAGIVLLVIWAMRRPGSREHRSG